MYSLSVQRGREIWICWIYFLNLLFTCSIGFQPRYYYLFVDNIAITNKEINLEREILTVLLKFRMKLVWVITLFQMLEFILVII